jgi:hypothetical protein
MRTHIVAKIAGALALALSAGVSEAQVPPERLPERMSFLDNGVIRLGVDLNRGGTITYLAESQGRPNVVNAYDLGREIQQAYYSGPRHPARADVPYSMWNPTAGGDKYGNPSPVLDSRNDGREIYVKNAPRNWENDRSIPGECVTETRINLDKATARVRHRLINGRSDRTQYPGEIQELPALFVNATLSRTVTYDGTEPYQSAPTRDIKDVFVPAGGYWSATERWSAMVDPSGWGLGLFQPEVLGYGGRFVGTPGAGGTRDNATNSFSPRCKEILDYNIIYEYDYTLILGTLGEIRAYAYAHRPTDPRPDHDFERDRRHWWYVNASDAGSPIRGGLRVALDRDDPEMIGPEGCWQAESAPKLYIRAAFHVGPEPPGNTNGEVFYRVPGQPGFSADRHVVFPIVPDNVFRTYEVDMASSPNYRGVITGLRFDPVMAGSPGNYVDVVFISCRKRY